MRKKADFPAVSSRTVSLMLLIDSNKTSVINGCHVRHMYITAENILNFDRTTKCYRTSLGLVQLFILIVDPNETIWLKSVES